MEYNQLFKKKKRKKETHPTLCHSMDGSGEDYAKKSKPVRKRQVSYDLT